MKNLATRLNERSLALCERSIELSDLLDIRVSRQAQATVLDFGCDRTGSIAGGIMLARICLADLANVNVTRPGSLGLPMVEVTTDHPLWACMASQYAGWAFSTGEYFAMGSGPARMSRGGEEMLEEYDLLFPSENVVGVLESGNLPGPAEAAEFLKQCHADAGSICVARTASLPGSIQVVARSVETTMHKLHELKFDLRKIKNALGSAPLPPIASKDLVALGWTNDSILYGAETVLWVDAEDEELKEIGPRIPSNSSRDFGKPFLEIFEAYDRDFYKIDRMLFSPARVVLHGLKSGNTFIYGEIRNDILAKEFQISAKVSS